MQPAAVPMHMDSSVCIDMLGSFPLVRIKTFSASQNEPVPPTLWPRPSNGNMKTENVYIPDACSVFRPRLFVVFFFVSFFLCIIPHFPKADVFATLYS